MERVGDLTKATQGREASCPGTQTLELQRPCALPVFHSANGAMKHEFLLCHGPHMQPQAAVRPWGAGGCWVYAWWLFQITLIHHLTKCHLHGLV